MTSSRLVRQPGTTLYAHLASVLRGRIVRGEWPVGHEIPTLDALSREHGIARVSVRQAVMLLVADGLLASHRGRRTVVVGTGEAARPLFPGLVEPLQAVPEYSVTILSRDERSSLPTAVTGMGRAARSYAKIRKVDSEAGVPYSVSDVYVASSLYRRFPKGAELHTKLSRLVRTTATAPLASVRERITISIADIAEAQALGFGLASPVARVQRVFLDTNGRILYVGWTVYRGDRFLLERELIGTAPPG